MVRPKSCAACLENDFEEILVLINVEIETMYQFNKNWQI